jgi:hypothetical protein
MSQITATSRDAPPTGRPARSTSGWLELPAQFRPAPDRSGKSCRLIMMTIGRRGACVVCPCARTRRRSPTSDGVRNICCSRYTTCHTRRPRRLAANRDSKGRPALVELARPRTRTHTDTNSHGKAMSWQFGAARWTTTKSTENKWTRSRSWRPLVFAPAGRLICLASPSGRTICDNSCARHPFGIAHGRRRRGREAQPRGQRLQCWAISGGGRRAQAAPGPLSRCPVGPSASETRHASGALGAKAAARRHLATRVRQIRAGDNGRLISMAMEMDGCVAPPAAPQCAQTLRARAVSDQQVGACPCQSGGRPGADGNQADTSGSVPERTAARFVRPPARATVRTLAGPTIHRPDINQSWWPVWPPR